MDILQDFKSRVVRRPQYLQSDGFIRKSIHQHANATQSHSLAQSGKYVERLLQSLLLWVPYLGTAKSVLHIDFSFRSWANQSNVISEAVHHIYGTERSIITGVSFRNVASVIQRTSLYMFSSDLFAYGIQKSIYDKEIRRVNTMILPSPCHTSLTADDAVCSANTIDLSQFLDRLPCKAAPIISMTDPEGLIGKMFPASITSPGARYVAACFWSWLCVLDDLTEDIEDGNALERCIALLSGSPYAPLSDESSAYYLMCAFHHTVQTASLVYSDPNSTSRSVEEPWKPVFWAECATVVQALLAEKYLIKGSFTMSEWLNLRVLTISARPLLVLLRASLGLPISSDNLTESSISNLPLILGLQNDILGFSKDFRKQNPFSAIQMLIRDGWSKHAAYSRIMDLHNHLVMEMLISRRETQWWSSLSAAEAMYERVAMGFVYAMAEWMIGCERYKV